MLLASPQNGCSSLLTCVIWFHCPMGPAQISGGLLYDSRITAEFLASGVTESTSFDGSVQSGFASNVEGSRSEMPMAPSACSVNRIWPDGSHRSIEGDALRPDVRLRGSPPETGRVKISPPVTPSSLISPPMKATDFPSGDQTGLAICMEVFKMGIVFPVLAAMVKSCATYQLLSPGPGAAVPTKVVPSGDRSYS